MKPIEITKPEVGEIWEDAQYPRRFKITKITMEPSKVDPEKKTEIVWGNEIDSGEEFGDYIGKFGIFYRKVSDD